MKKKYVLFDFDGVIADTEESNSHYLGLALKEFGVELTEKDKQRLIGTHDQELLIEFLSRSPRKVTVEQLTRRRKELGNTYENGNIAPIPGIVPLIQGLTKRSENRTRIFYRNPSYYYGTESDEDDGLV